MKIAILSPNILPIPATKGGAIETLVTYLINENELSKELEFHIFSNYDEEASIEASNYKNTKINFVNYNATFFEKIFNKIALGIHVVSKKKIPYFNSFFMRISRKVIKNHEIFDKIICEGSWEYYILLKKIPVAKKILHLHTDILNKNVYNAKEVCKSFSLILTVSNYIKERVLEIDSDLNVCVLKNSADIKLFNLSNINIRDLVRQELGFSKTDFVVLFVGRISKIKGVNLLVDSLNYVKNKNIKILIVGANWFSSDEKNKYEKMLEDKSAKFFERIKFTGYIDHESVSKYMCCADIGVVPSICNEAFPLVTIEMQNCGLTVLATKIGGIPEGIKDSSNLLELNSNFSIRLAEKLDVLSNIDNFYFLNCKENNIFAREFNTENYFKNFLSIVGKHNG